MKTNGEDVVTGTTIRITPERGKNGTIRLKVFLECTDVISPARGQFENPDESGPLRPHVKPGQVLRLGVGKRDREPQWVELVVKEVEAEKSALIIAAFRRRPLSY
jgi:hypothetical protein